ncbi:aldose 1-epimerase [Actinomycetaceae bacterium L2_0104]
MVASETSIEAVDFFGQPAWRLVAPGGASALIAERGATLLSWQPTPGAEVIDGYADADELAARTDHADARSLIMAPWCGRLSHGSYRFDGERYTVAPDEIAAWPDRVAGLDFVREAAGDALLLRAVLPSVEGYPWELAVTVVFSLEGGAEGLEHLSLSIEVLNLSEETAPVAIGWLPYVKMPGVEGISNLSLSIPARSKILTDSRQIPLNGDAALAGIAAPARYDYLGHQKIDQSYSNLVPNEDGVVVTSVTNPVRGTQVLLTQEPSEAPVMHVYTGDAVARRPRGSIALGPYSELPDAFNRADAASRIPLLAGDTRSLTVTLSYRGVR